MNLSEFGETNQIINDKKIEKEYMFLFTHSQTPFAQPVNNEINFSLLMWQWLLGIIEEEKQEID